MRRFPMRRHPFVSAQSALRRHTAVGVRASHETVIISRMRSFFDALILYLSENTEPVILVSVLGRRGGETADGYSRRDWARETAHRGKASTAGCGTNKTSRSAQ